MLVHLPAGAVGHEALRRGYLPAFSPVLSKVVHARLARKAHVRHIPLKPDSDDARTRAGVLQPIKVCRAASQQTLLGFRRHHAHPSTGAYMHADGTAGLRTTDQGREEAD